jgi:sporulation protein YlmC with PRC-barrel domain
MVERWDIDNLSRVRGKAVYSSDGEKIGSVQEIFYDETSGEPEWLELGGGFLGLKRRIVPIEGLLLQRDHLEVPYTKDKVDQEPDIEAGDRISDLSEAALSGYFGLSGEHRHEMNVFRQREV